MNLLFSQPPPPSSRPPVIECKILHNSTGILTLAITNDTSYIVEYTSPGVYQFSVLAYNILGDGNGSTIFVTGYRESKHYLYNVSTFDIKPTCRTIPIVYIIL